MVGVFQPLVPAIAGAGILKALLSLLILMKVLDAAELFTRPRRFGKTLNMSMLEHFFSLDGDKSIFDGLEIAGEKALCEEYMGKYPVVSISLKGIDARTYETAYQMAVRIIMDAAAKFYFLLDSEKLNEHDKAEYKDLLDKKMDEGLAGSSLKLLSGLLEKHYGKKVILLIDEYDVPLAKAHANGYYDRMISLIRSLLGQALKTNSSLKFAVLTGCLRISKESIFTGLNNLKVLSVTDERFDEYFGFTDKEVRELLTYYGIEDHYEAIKTWYDGDLDGACEEALKQIEHTGYEEDLEDDGVEKILKYGIACYKKRCRVMLERFVPPDERRRNGD